MTNKEEIEKQTKKYVQDAKEFLQLPIKDAMKRRIWDLPLTEKDSEMLDVIAVLCTNDHIWVVDNLKNKIVVGVITEHDILHALEPVKKHSFFGMPTRRGMGLSLFETAEHIMSHHPLTCHPNQKVKEVLHMMEAHNVRRLPVVKVGTNEIVSEVTVHQLIKIYYEIAKPLCELCETSEDKKKLLNKKQLISSE